MNLTFSIPDRKPLVKALGEILGEQPKYTGAPRFSYSVGSYLVNTQGEIAGPDSPELAEKLRERGFEPVETLFEDTAQETTETFSIEIPDDLTTAQFESLQNFVKTHEYLLRCSLRTQSPMTLERVDGRLRFDWFPEEEADNFSMYDTLVRKIVEHTKNRKCHTRERNSAHSENPRFYVRLMLVRLGMIGYEYAAARRLLTRHLPGNAAWKSGTTPKKQQEDQVA